MNIVKSLKWENILKANSFLTSEMVSSMGNYKKQCFAVSTFSFSGQNVVNDVSVSISYQRPRNISIILFFTVLLKDNFFFLQLHSV